jgi:hypothetical protein
MPTKQYLTANVLYLQKSLTKQKLHLVNSTDFKQIKTHFLGKKQNNKYLN